MTSHDSVPSHSDHTVRRPIITRHPLWLSATLAAVAGVAALFAASVPEQGARQESAPPHQSVGAPAGTEGFQYFPQQYENQGKQIEEPIATF